MKRVVMALVVCVLLAACGGRAQTLDFVAQNTAYTTAPAEAKAGEATFVLANKDTIEHYVVIDELGLVVEAHGGETARQTTVLKPGTYTYYCRVPGHREAGMQGDLVVT